MQSDSHLDTVLLAAGSRENDLINFHNERSRFMFNFGAGGGAMLLQRGADKNVILGASAYHRCQSVRVGGADRSSRWRRCERSWANCAAGST